MSRPLGSKNKTKEEETSFQPTPVLAPVVAAKSIASVPVISGCKTCGHETGKHYGSKKNWCNVIGCECKGLK